jgi:hypothetical protein
MSHTYSVVLMAPIYVTVYDATSEDDALAQAKGMVEALDDRDTQHEMNHGHVYFGPPDEGPATVDHDPQCLSVEHDDD